MSGAPEEDKPWWRLPAAKFPSPETLRWVAEACGKSARVVASRRLTGGIISSVHRLTVENTAGTRSQVVLRRYLGSDRAQRPADSIRREAAVLQALQQTGLPVPRLLAADPEGQAAGGFPALLMSTTRGSVHLAPRDPRSWLKQMASMAARIHNLTLEAPLRTRAASPSQRQVPAWVADPEVWRQAISATAGRSPVLRAFIHADYQHFNLLWARGRLTGVVDWVSSAFGHPDTDVGHCRLNLAVLFSPDYAEQFRLAYEAEAGRNVDPWYDLTELMQYSPDWQGFIPIQVAGRVPVDTVGMTARVEEVMRATLARG